MAEPSDEANGVPPSPISALALNMQRGLLMKDVECPISGKPMELVFAETVLGKYMVSYYYCNESGLLKTEKPYWLDEAYQEAIADTDTGLVGRNINNSNMLEVVLYLLDIENEKVLDVAGGYGLLTRLMRDKGFDCFTTDKYCKNLFAKTFEPDSHFKAKALFAFEVLEHIENPLQFFNDCFSMYGCKTMIFSTLTFANEVPSKDWWYYSFEGGQHITFYQSRTLSLIADKLSCKYHMLNSDLHIITDKNINWISKIILNNKLRRLLSIYVRYKRRGSSKTWADHLQMKEYFKKS